MDWSLVYSWLTEQVTTNEFFAGGMVMGAIGWLLMVARDWPVAIGGFLARQLMTKVTIRSTDGEAFLHIALFMAKHPSRRLARRLGMIDYWDNDAEDDGGLSSAHSYEVTFGFGNHVLWDRWWRPVFISRTVNDENANTSRPPQIIEITMFGRNHAGILRLIEEARRQAKASTKVSVNIWVSGHYMVADRREPRPMSSIIMDGATKESMVADMLRFLDGKAWYRERGLPYRRGYLLEGPPGTGKSSTIMAMAGLAKKSVCIINPATVMDDNELQRAISEAGSNIVVMEDIDAVKISNARKVETEKEDEDKPQRRGLTLSGLLNAIDGVASRDGRILFITSNHPDRLDAALLRPGRIDRRVHLGLLDRELGAQMWERFYPGEDPTAFLDSIEWPVTPASLQGRLLEWDDGTVVDGVFQLDRDHARPHKEGAGCGASSSTPPRGKGGRAVSSSFPARPPF